MQNNVKLLAIRYLPGLVLLGGGWEEGLGRWGCQDPHLKGGKERRTFNICFSVISWWSPSQGRFSGSGGGGSLTDMDFVTGLVLPLASIAVHVRAAWFWLSGTAQCPWELGERCVTPPLPASAPPGPSPSTASLSVSDTAPPRCGSAVAPSSKALGGDHINMALCVFSSLTAWLGWGQHVGTFSPRGAWWSHAWWDS